VQKTVAILAMDSPDERLGAADSADTAKLAYMTAKAAGELINEQSSNQLQDELEE